MKKTIGLIGLLTVFTMSIFAKQIDENTAKQVGQNFLATRTNSPALSKATTLDLVYLAKSKANSSVALTIGTTYFYVFNTSSAGFVMVSADDIVTPILGYSDEGAFDPNNIPQNTTKWLEDYKSQIRYAIENGVAATAEISTEWQDLIVGKNTNGSARGTNAVSPLIQTKWDQSPNYNALCPYDNQYGQRTITGCVATAMAQVMKYWNYPASGTSFHSYNHAKYGTLSANFGSTTYQWTSMPNTVSGANSAVATLMYHCGVSVDMDYGISSQGGSGAQTLDVVDALKTYFGYSSSVEGKSRSNYSDSQWKTLLKTELNASRPMQYAGTGSGGGHSFVCDGYDNNDFFHFNWGWSGSSDGYFSVNALNPGSLGSGGGTGGFNSNQRVIIGIKPPQVNTTTDMRLYSSITVNPTPIDYNSGFSVSVSLANFGTSSTNNFTGDFCAAIFNSNNQFVSYIETKAGYTLNFNSHFTNPIVFTTASISALTPGDYIIGVYHKATGATQWTAFGNGNYQNFIPIQVQGNSTNTIRLYAAISTTPTVITQNQAFTVNFDVVNRGNSGFTGDISVDIHKSDGTWIRELDIKTALSLPTNNHFTNGLTYTITGGISDAPGTYQLFVWDKPSGGSWEFVGNGSYANPITIQVVAPGLNPDPYEVNNTVGQAYTLPISFSGNTATRNTVGSNCHIGSDYDYYKINLPAGYTYSIAPRLHDSYNSANGNSYSLDALFSYSTDGSTWSDAYDDVMSSNITANGGSPVYFHVSPYFTGQTGTYLLDMNISRSLKTSIEEDELQSAVILYPNPAKSIVTLDLRDFNESVSQVNILNLQGQSIVTLSDIKQQEQLSFSLTDFSAGVYFVQIQSKNGMLTKKLIIEK